MKRKSCHQLALAVVKGVVVVGVVRSIETKRVREVSEWSAFA